MKNYEVEFRSQRGDPIRLKADAAEVRDGAVVFLRDGTFFGAVSLADTSYVVEVGETEGDA